MMNGSNEANAGKGIKGKLKTIWRIFAFIIGSFFTIVVIYFFYRFFTGLANVTFHGIASLFAYTKQLADDIVTAIVNGFITAVTYPFKFVDEIIGYIFG